MAENQNSITIENDSHDSASQFLGFLAADKGVLCVQPGQNNGADSPKVMAIPISALFVQHKRPARAERESA